MRGYFVAEYARTLIVFVVGFLTSTVAASATNGCTRFFDATLYANKSKATTQYLESVTVVYGVSEWWMSDDARGRPPDATKVKLWAQAANSNSEVTVIDIETWPTTGEPKQVARTIEDFQVAIRSARESGRRGTIGIYGVLPNRSYWRAVVGEDSEKYKKWQAENTALATLVGDVDALFPSLYTFYDDLEGWKKYAGENLKEARRIAMGKPVYAFLWPQYHPSNQTHGFSYLPDDMWNEQLEFVASRADGIVIWGGWGEGKRLVWNERAPWWIRTKEFVKQSRVTCSRL